MKTASVKEIREELAALTQNELLSICLRLVKFKKENKELITYMVFESADENSFIKAVQEMLDAMFLEVNTKNLYYAKKTLRKIVRTANRYTRYSGKDTTEADILIYVCKKINELGIKLQKSTALLNLYESLLKKIRKNVLSMHEDLQYDYLKELSALNLD